MRNIDSARIDHLASTYGELVDHRSCVCYQQIIDLTSYDDAHVIEVREAQDVCNVTDAPNTFDDCPLLSAYEFDSEREASDFWAKLIGDRAREFARS